MTLTGTTHRRHRGLAVAAALSLSLLLPTGASVSAQSGAALGCPSYGAGTAMVFCSGSEGRSEIFERAPDGSVRQLTYLGAYATSPSISPDGTTVAFQASTSLDPEPQIYTIPRHGPRLRHIVVGTSVIELGDRTVMVGGTPIEIEAARPTRLTSAGANWDPAFSPGGDRIAFTSDRLGTPSLWSMNVDGSDQHELFLATAGN